MKSVKKLTNLSTIDMANDSFTPIPILVETITIKASFIPKEAGVILTKRVNVLTTPIKKDCPIPRGVPLLD